MDWRKAFLFAIGLAALASASEVSAWTPFCNMLSHVAKVAVSQPQARPDALSVLERVATAKAAATPMEVELAAGLPQSALHDTAFGWPQVRACALEKLGTTGLPEALDFLKTLNPERDFTKEPDVQNAFSIATQEATFRQIHDPGLQVEYLESEAMHSAWAVNQLCDRGALGSLVTLQRAIRGFWRGDERGEKEVAFCEERIRLLYGKPDRAKALGSVLSLDSNPDSPENSRLFLWAVGQLASMHTPEAEAELNRFVNQIRALPPRSEARQRFFSLEQTVGNIRFSHVE